jgi:hypothetical protein
MVSLHPLIAVTATVAGLATGASLMPVLAMDVAAPVAAAARHLTSSSFANSDTSGPTPAMYAAIRGAAASETKGTMEVEKIDYVGRHGNGAGSVGYIFYIYFSDASGLKYERFVRVLRTADGTLHVLSA